MTAELVGDDPLLLGIDIGTSGVKGVLCAPGGRVVASHRIAIAVSRPRPGWAEHDPQSDWWDSVCKVIRELLNGCSHAGKRIAGIGVSGVCPVVLPVDSSDEPVRRAILYSIDRRAVAELEELAAYFDHGDVLARAGQPLGTQNIVAKLLWLRKYEPEVWSRTRHVLGSTGFVVARLTGVHTVDHFTASDGGLGYMLDARDWDREVFETADLPIETMPALTWPTDVVGHVRSTVAAELGVREGTPVVAGTGDALAELIGAGAATPGDGALLYGTSLSTMVLAGSRSRSPSVVTVPGWRRDQLVQSAILPLGSGLLEWWSRFCGETWDELWFTRIDDALRTSPPGARGLLHLPYLTGTRSRESIRGALLGMRVDHTEADRVRAVAEGMAHALRAELDDNETPVSLRAIGGGARSTELVQVISDVCGFEQPLIELGFGAARGAAWLAARGVGLHNRDDAQDWTRTTDRILPRVELAGTYQRQHGRFVAAMRSGIVRVDAIDEAPSTNC